MLRVLYFFVLRGLLCIVGVRLRVSPGPRLSALGDLGDKPTVDHPLEKSLLEPRLEISRLEQFFVNPRVFVPLLVPL